MLAKRLLGLLADARMVSLDKIKGGIVFGFAFAVDAVEVLVEGTPFVDFGLFDVGGVEAALFEFVGEIEDELAGGTVEVGAGDSSAHFECW